MQHTDRTTMERLSDMADASDALKDALIRRDTEAILAAVEVQDSLAAELREAGASHAGQRDPVERRGIVDLVARIKRTQHTNTMLAGSFLKLVDRTLTRLSTGIQPGMAVYGATGGLTTRITPILIEQKG